MKRGDPAWTTWNLGTYSVEEWKIFSANEQMTFNVISFVYTDSPVSVLGDLNVGGTRSKAGNWPNGGIVKFGCYIAGGSKVMACISTLGDMWAARYIQSFAIVLSGLLGEKYIIIMD